VPLEEDVPGVRCMLAGGGKKVGVGESHDEALQGRMREAAKGSIARLAWKRWPALFLRYR
jgi:hypothetical protein